MSLDSRQNLIAGAEAAETTAVETDAIETILPDAATRKPRPRMFAALAVRNYRIWMAGAFVSNIGTWMQRVAQDWFVLELSHGSGVAVGITTALQFLPMLLLSPVGGLVADRFSKRSILKLTQLWLAG